jgi:hypothetical protein
MKRYAACFALFSLLLVTGATASHAQASRTWVSGVGDDVNPCSRTAPCKTFAGAISKTAPAGEINVLDPGAFGAVTITKAITISSEGFEAGVLVSGTNGIVVAAGASDAVVLRGLDIEGLGTGLDGIHFTSGASLHVENCTINDFSHRGISFAPSAGTSSLFVKDSFVRNNAPVSGGSFGGIFVAPTGGAVAEASIDNVRILRNFHGLRVQGNSRVAARNSTAAGNGGTGFLVTAATNTQLNLDGCEASDNVNGIRAESAGGVVRIANTLVTNNTNGLLTGSGGAIVSFGNNRVAGNFNDGAPTSTVGQQ